MEKPTLHGTLTHPFGTGTPDRGTTKEEVLANWGNPNRIIPHGSDELGNPKEEWIYEGRVPVLPVDYGYVSQTKHLFFEGNSLQRWEAEGSQQATSSSETLPPRS